MSKPDDSRRNFLIGAAAGAGVVAGAALVHEYVEDRGQSVTADAAGHAHPQAGGQRLGSFFNAADAATIAAFAERLMPGAPDKPGAGDADVLNYIDLALSGSYADQQDFYRRGLAQFDAFCRNSYDAPFVQLEPTQQDAAITALEADNAIGFDWPTARAFFETVRTHTLEGMFADPIYGGNKAFSGWRLVGFPGAQPAFSAADLQSTEAFADGTIIGLNAQTTRS